MHPISRRISGDMTMRGQTTHHGHPSHVKSNSTGADHPHRHHFFRYHARSGPSIRDSKGHFGSGEEGHAHMGRGKMRGGMIEDYSTQPTEVGSRPSFGTPSTTQPLLHVGKTKSFFDHVTNYGKDRPMKHAQEKPRRKMKQQTLIKDDADWTDTVGPNWKKHFGNHSLYKQVIDYEKANPLYR